MLYDFIIADKSVKTPMYRQIYMSVRNSIENGSLKKGTKLPSIRRLAKELDISVTTVISAYDQLSAEGYITNVPQSGYYVAANFESISKSSGSDSDISEGISKFYKYDFTSKSIDENIINLSEWKKNIKDVINTNYLLTSYGDVQGEPALRNALQKYALGTRSVNTTSERIVIGAGTQPLLYMLCSLLGNNKRVAMADASFVQSEFVFRSFSYDIKYFEYDKYGVTVKSLDRIKPDIVLINPNFSGTKGDNMPVTRRIEIINWAKNNNAVIIEDDYNGELRYSTNPTPCMQNYDAENTVYIGSFSKVLLPSVRISYMALPEKIYNSYKGVKKYTNQTASKTEQLALAKYLNTNKIDIHLRRARRVYLEKSKTILESISRHIPDSRVIFNETSLYVTVKLKQSIDRKLFESELEKKSVKIMPYKISGNEFGLSFSGISQDKIDDGIKIIGNIIHTITK